MIPVHAYKDQHIALLGLDEAGLSLACALLESGARVSAWDADRENRDRAQSHGITIEDLTSFDWGDLAALVVDDASLLQAGTNNRLIDLARAVDIPVRAARAVLTEAVMQAPNLKAVILTGQHADACAQLSIHLLAANGIQARTLIDDQASRLNAPVVLCPLSNAEISNLRSGAPLDGIVALQGEGASVAEADQKLEQLSSRAEKAVIAAVNAPNRARLIAGRDDEAALGISAKMVLSRGVYAAGGEIFDAISGRAQRLGLIEGLMPTEPVLAAIALARRYGVPSQTVCERLDVWEGLAGYGRCVLDIGQIRAYDWSCAQSAAQAIEVLRGETATFWIAGPNLDPEAGNLLRRTPNSVKRVYLLSDRRKAEAQLSRVCQTSRHRNLSNAFARALHDAAKLAAPVHIVFAPGSQSEAFAENHLDDVMTALFVKAREDKAA